MILKGDSKFKGKLTRGLKIDMKTLVNFDASSRKSENLNFDGLLLYKVSDEKYRRVISHDLVPKMT